MTDRKHYDGENPQEPLAPGHFRDSDLNDAQQLGDGSPAIERRDGKDESEARSGEPKSIRTD